MRVYFQFLGIFGAAVLIAIGTAPVMAVEPPPVLAWNATLGGSNGDIASAVQQTGDGGYIVAGGTGSNDGDVGLFLGNFDCWVVKLDGAGHPAWNVTLGGSEYDYASAVQQTSDGGYIVAGHTGSSGSGDVGFNRGESDAWVVKLDGAGHPAWNRTLGGSGSDYAYAVQQTSDGGYVVAGSTSSSRSGDVGLNHGRSDAWVVKLDDAGQMAWNATLGGSGADSARAVRQASDGGYIVTGETESSESGDVGLNHGGYDAWMLKLDGAGRIVWNVTLGGSSTDIAYAVQQTSDGGYVVAGYTGSKDGDIGLNHGSYDCWVVQLDGAGLMVWNATLGGSGRDYANAVQQTADGGYVVAGRTYSSGSGDVSLNHGDADCWVVKLDGAGQMIWNAPLGGSGYDEAAAVRQASDGGYVLAGSTGSNDGDVGLNHGGFDYWVVKLKADTPTVFVIPGSTSLPTDSNGDGVYDDVNGNNRKDFADVVLYFNQMTWIAANEPVAAFDYNKNGRIDFADVVWLFNHL